MRVRNGRALRLRATSAILLLAALGAGCAIPAGHPALEQADAAVERARRSPRVRALAAAELDHAEVALQDARAAARAGASPNRVDHLVYIVNQRAALAEARAAQQVARSEIERLEGALDDVLIPGRLAQGRERRAWFPAQDGQRRAPLDVQAHARLAEDRPAQTPLRTTQQAGAPLQELQQTPRPLQSPQPAPALLQEPQRVQTPLQGPQQAQAPLQEPQQAPAPLHEPQQAPASLQETQQAQTPLQEPQQTPAQLPGQQEQAQLQEPQQVHGSVEEAREVHGPGEEPQVVPGSVEEDRQIHGSVEGVQEAVAAEPDPVAADVEALPQEITLRLAQLSFAGAEPTSETSQRLAAVAEQLLREPERSVLIEAEFNLPDPEARTTLEQRVEIVRAMLLRRGIAPTRVVVRASGDSTAEPRAAPSFIEAPF